MAMSSVIKIYKVFCDGCWYCGVNRVTYEKKMHTWLAFWSLLISSGFKFAVDDLVKIKKLCDDAGRDKPWWHEPDEGHYSLAVRWGNLSFVYAYEKLVGRIPFIGTGLDYDDDPYVRGGTTAKQQGRVVVGCEFMWEGEKVKVTTFRDKEHALLACAYHPKSDDDYSPCKIKRRFKITNDMWAAANRLQKDVDKLKAERISIDFKAGWGYAVADRRVDPQNPVYYDSTGKIEAGKNLDKYKPFKTLAKAYRRAIALKESGETKHGS